MSLDIYKFHTDPTKLNGYGSEDMKIYKKLQAAKDHLLSNFSGYKLRNVIRSSGVPLEKIEKIISTDAQFSYTYALNQVRGRFEMGEKVMSKHAYFAYLYACNILKGRFEMGEESIKKDEELWEMYQEDVINAQVVAQR